MLREFIGEAIKAVKYFWDVEAPGDEKLKAVGEQLYELVEAKDADLFNMLPPLYRSLAKAAVDNDYVDNLQKAACLQVAEIAYQMVAFSKDWYTGLKDKINAGIDRLEDFLAPYHQAS